MALHEEIKRIHYLPYIIEFLYICLKFWVTSGLTSQQKIKAVCNWGMIDR